MIKRFQTERELVLALFFCALFIRVLFVLFGAQYYYGENIHIHNDTFSYTQSFLNLLNYGEYTYDLNSVEAHFHRLPGYPFFWGLHYLVVGEAWASIATSMTQAILDSIAAVLIFDLVRTVFKSKATGAIASLIYVFYPFVIVWIPMMIPESLATFFVVLFFWAMYKLPNDNKKFILLGVIACLALYTRTYLGVLIVSGAIYVFINTENTLKKRFAYALILFVSFSTLFSPWVIRNIYFHNQLVFLMGKTSGYSAYSIDFSQFRKWVTLWDNDIVTHAIAIAVDGELKLPQDLDIHDSEKKEINRVVSLAHKCGSSFHEWRVWRGVADAWYDPSKTCDDEVSKGFVEIRKTFISKRLVYSYTYVPFLNLKKIFLKNELTTSDKDSWKNVLIKTLFSYRSAIVIFGVLGIIFLLFRSEFYLFPMMFFPVFMYVFISSVIRQMDMHYVLQADVVVAMFTSFFVCYIYESIKKHYLNTFNYEKDVQ